MTRVLLHRHFIYGCLLVLAALLVIMACAPDSSDRRWRQTEDVYGPSAPKKEDHVSFGCTVRSLLNFSCDD